ncbi:sensor domain-containing diguanylate cyclase [Synechococcus elongatus]|nr:sensor domain-containing diguanylate cyclase [Synechococcus elongatus]WKW05173.1 sensor domain-containing diguanylate cyclase [Synechococcus elongatus PCC 7942 = FACHB-805]
MNFRTRLAIGFSGLLMLSSLVISTVIGQRTVRLAQTAAGDSLQETAYQFSTLLDQSMWSRANEIVTLSSVPDLLSDRNRPEIQRLLDRLKRELPVFTWVGLLDRQGKVIASTDRIIEGVNISSRPVFANGIKGLFIGDVHDAVLLASKFPRQANGEPIQFVDISIPIQDRDGKPTGVLASHLSWEWARDAESTILSPIAADRRVELLVVATDRTILLGPQEFGKGATLNILPRVLKAGESRWQVLRWPDGQDYMTAYRVSAGYRTYNGLGWITITRQPIAVAYAPAHQLQRDIILFTLLSSGAVVGVAWLLADWFAKPLRQLSSWASRLEKGDRSDRDQLPWVGELGKISRIVQRLDAQAEAQSQARKQAESLAHHDALTGLQNRLGLAAYLSQYQSLEPDQSLVILAIDLDGFKPINDTYGHAMGDVLLKAVAARLHACIRANELAARTGGDEFLVILPCSVELAEAIGKQVGARILQALNSVFPLQGQQIEIGSSIGLAVWPVDHPDLQTVFQAADTALYDAKQHGKGHLVRWTATLGQQSASPQSDR